MNRITVILAALALLGWCQCSFAADVSLDEARKVLEADMAAIHAAGEPTTVDDLKQPAVPDAANGAIEIRSAYDSIDTTTAAYQRFTRIDPLEPVTPAMIQALREVAAENATALDLVGAALAKGKFDWQLKLASPLITVPLPELAKLRTVATIVRASAIAAHHEDHDDLALQHIGHLLGLSRAADQSQLLISHLVALGIGRLATDAAGQIAPTLDAPAAGPARKRALELAAALLDDKSLQQSLRSSLIAERVNVFDLALAIADERISPAELDQIINSAQAPLQQAGLDPTTVKRIALEDAHQLLPYYHDVIEAASAADWPTLQSKLPKPPVAAPDRYFHSVALVSANKVFEAQYRHIAGRRLAAIALVARCYALDNAGKLPRKLGDLVPAYLSSVPTDPFTAGKPVNYRPDQGIIYSIGPDGKDDGGKVPAAPQLQPDIVVHLRP